MICNRRRQSENENKTKNAKISTKSVISIALSLLIVCDRTRDSLSIVNCVDPHVHKCATNKGHK